MTKTVDTEVSVSALSHEASAKKLGADAPQTVDETIASIVIMKEDAKLGPFTLRNKLDDAKVDWSVFPVVGSEGGNNPHYYDALSDKGRDIQGNFFRDYILGMQWGSSIASKLADAKLAANVETAGQSKMYQQYVGNTRYLEDEIAMLKARLTSATNLLTSAVELYQQEETFLRLADKDKVTLGFNEYEDDKGNTHAKRTNQPYIISDAKKPALFTRLNVGQVLRMDVAQAVKNGGTYAAFIATLKKETKASTANIKIENDAQAFAMMGALAEYFAWSTESGAKHFERFRQVLRKDGSDDHLNNYGLLVQSLDAGWGEFEKPYNALAKKTAGETKDVA